MHWEENLLKDMHILKLPKMIEVSEITINRNPI